MGIFMLIVQENVFFYTDSTRKLVFLYW